jgi:8-oxo-dGTP diphosphatase
MKSVIAAIIGGSLPTEEQPPILQSAHAVLLFHGQYILQLRDDKPGIAAPGQWCLFGGLIDPLETPLQAIMREIDEELSLKPVRFDFLWFTDYRADYEKQRIRTWFFKADVSLIWSEHVLHEGKEAAAFDYDETVSLEMPGVMRDTIDRHEKKRHAKSTRLRRERC